MLDWNKVEQRRASWSENQPLKDSELTVAPKTISRCLSLIDLEPMVATLIGSGITSTYNRSLTPLQIETLQRNIQDEDTHERALKNAQIAIRNYDSSFEAEAANIVSYFDSIQDNPITKAAALENGLFFVLLPIYRFYGSTSLKITANSISRDELIHVQTHRAASEILGANPSTKLLKCIRDIVWWVTQDIEEETKDHRRPLTLQFCLDQSKSLLTNGTSEFKDTESAIFLAPYEIPNTDLDSYAARV